MTDLTDIATSKPAQVAAASPREPWEPPMRIKLRRLRNVPGIYGATRDVLPARMCFLHPDAARDFLTLQGAQLVRVSDMYKSADASLAARHQKRGVQPPSFSGHGVGASIDVDVSEFSKRTGMDKRGLDELMASHNWHCHRRDHGLGSESWHFNHLSSKPEKYLARCENSHSTARALEAWIQDHYGAAIDLSPLQIQGCLRRLRMYSGALDGKLGPLSRQGVLLFQRAWGLAPTGSADTLTQRTLSFVAADLDIVE